MTLVTQTIFQMMSDGAKQYSLSEDQYNDLLQYETRLSRAQETFRREVIAATSDIEIGIAIGQHMALLSGVIELLMLTTGKIRTQKYER